MKLNPQNQNNTTQPRPSYKIFNNWEVVTNGWYEALESKKLKPGKALGVDVAGQHLVLFRGESGRAYALDGFCPHMGVDLGIGNVIGEEIRCFFHHWKFDGKGQCKDIPCLDEKKLEVKTNNYKVLEKYGRIWVYPNSEAPYDVLEVPELEGQNVSFSFGKRYKRKCHFHVTMINGIDPQHLSTVHNINMNMDVTIDQSEEDTIDINLEGKTPDSRFSERLVKKLLGDRYAYSMKYQGGCLAALSVMKGVKLFNKWEILPTLHMLFAYQSHLEGETIVQPIFLTKKRNFLIDRILLLFTRLAFKMLQGEDGEVYENIRFNTQNLLPIDAPVTKYIKYINGLTPSLWSRQEPEDPKLSIRKKREITV